MWSRLGDLRRANAADIDGIMDIERQPDYDRLVGRWTRIEHERNLARPGYVYLVHDDAEGRPVAFFALSGLGNHDGDAMMNRMILRHPGRGLGSRLLPRVMRLVFEGFGARKFWLRVAPYNERAIRLYRHCGFQDEKLLPKAGRRPDGEQIDLLLMSIDWEAWDEQENAATS
ncbi:GNAT family N-acetyltransferase [Rhizobium sp. TRM95796]|uniref:GNAT family N-acetyltransferase n=1 Tax=Rhizobium sp. TRM95796 TaxID=2979862 RepID=UPI0021E85DDE|nr:GNAT family protein [Rhizobium sp. TRM95796]MCV3766271.1 GNAT family N-acetyltransferase [Rhizobium sp. TRM95796]